MKRFIIGKVVAVSAILLLGPLGCYVQGDAREAVEERSNPGNGFEQHLLEIARSYKTYGRLGDQARMTFQFCQPAIFPGQAGTPPEAPVRLSASEDSDTHGRKLYWLYVKEMPAHYYTGGDYTPAEGLNPVGQVVVKEAWHPVEVKGNDNKATQKVPLVSGKAGRLYRPGSQADLFIMFKLDAKTPGTDEGWVYGTVTPDGKEVTCAGRVASCMGCHADAPHDRLFGLAKK
jgi:hypothetical protein